MNERAEYFAILAALCVSTDHIDRNIVAELAYAVWAAGNRIANEAGMKKEVK